MQRAASRWLFLLLAATCSLSAAPAPYHLTFEAPPAAPFPFLGKFGRVTVHVYPAGVRAESVWLNGFSRNGSSTITVENPLGRMFTDVPLREIASILRSMSTAGMESVAPEALQKPVAGAVHGLPALRYRLRDGPEAWIDVWTTNAIPANPQFRAIALEFVNGISPPTGSVMRAVPGMPVYVELNFRRYKRLPLLRLQDVAYDARGQEDSLKVGKVYFRAPFLDAIWK